MEIQLSNIKDTNLWYSRVWISSYTFNSKPSTKANNHCNFKETMSVCDITRYLPTPVMWHKNFCDILAKTSVIKIVRLLLPLKFGTYSHKLKECWILVRGQWNRRCHIFPTQGHRSPAFYAWVSVRWRVSPSVEMTSCMASPSSHSVPKPASLHLIFSELFTETSPN